MNGPAVCCRSRLPLATVMALACVLVVGGCGEPNAESAGPTGVTAAASAVAQPFASVMPPAPETPPPLVDRSVHSVPLADVVFDTFRGGYVRLSEASPRTVEVLRDAIPPIYAPRYGGVPAGAWMGEGDFVIGYQGRTAAYAYPLKMLNFHEIVNELIDGVPVLISYCPLCGSGVVFANPEESLGWAFRRQLDGRTLTFESRGDAILDRETQSNWAFHGIAIAGPMQGRRLQGLPSRRAFWFSVSIALPHARVYGRKK